MISLKAAGCAYLFAVGNGREVRLRIVLVEAFVLDHQPVARARSHGVVAVFSRFDGRSLGGQFGRRCVGARGMEGRSLQSVGLKEPQPTSTSAPLASPTTRASGAHKVVIVLDTRIRSKGATSLLRLVGLSFAVFSCRCRADACRAWTIASDRW